MADVITCPSGLQGAAFADRALAKSGAQACPEETRYPGPYALAAGAKLDLGKVLQGDRSFALHMLRAELRPRIHVRRLSAGATGWHEHRLGTT